LLLRAAAGPPLYVTMIAAGLVRFTSGRAAGAAAPALLQASALAMRSARREGHNIKAPDVPWKIYHPSIQEPERKVHIHGSVKGPARYVPPNFRHQQYVESLRSGEHLGPDWPHNFLGGTFWKDRRYNVSYNPIPADVSVMTGVAFLPRAAAWEVEWWEQDKQRIAQFKTSIGFMHAKNWAENFRKNLVAAGRVDNRRTERQVRLAAILGRNQKNLMKRRFLNKDARRRGNSGSKMGPAKRARADYKTRGLLT